MGLFDFFSRKKNVAPPSGSDRQLLEKIEVMPGIVLPRAFAGCRKEIEATKLSFISITATPQTDLTLEQSKFGHYPYMPLDVEYPTDTEGRPMFPLAQIDCKDLNGLAGYPLSGYLQFYISAFDDAYGLDFENTQSQKNARVQYFEEQQLVNYKADFSFLDNVLASDQLPFSKPMALSFTTKEEYIGIGDVRYEENEHFKFSSISQQYPDIEDELEEATYDFFQSNGHKVGGYAFFTQVDPRIDDDILKDYVLLLQIDSDDNIMWGDVGVANFFIHPDDLAKKDFSKVMYTWDCG